ncbi:DUF2057 family protein [Marinobacter sp. GH_1]|uniref:DUF2057 family protein n=1 Tax=Marinobacter sp. GH_1 TaxID=3402164 RepID=UPI003B42BA77
MSMCHVSRVFKLVALMLSVTLVGCASSLTRVDAWQGDPEGAATPAVLKAPGEIQVAAINGRSMTRFMLDDLALDYGLLPGETEVVFTYKTIWARTGVVRDGESKVHTVESEQQVVRFDAQPGAEYRFRFDKPSSRQQAEAMMADFSAAIIDSNGALVAESSKWDGASQGSASRTPLAASGGSAGSEPGSTTLERLKALWEDATEEEKRTFLRWAFE